MATEASARTIASPARLAPRGAAAAIVVGVLLAAVAAVALTVHAATGALLPGERAFAEALQATPGGAALEWVADILALSLVEYPLLIGATFIAARARNYPLAFAVVLVMLGRMTSAPLKELIERPRPEADELLIREPAPGFGFPSGHAMTVVLVYGYAAAVAMTHLPRRWGIAALAAALVAAVLIAFDRVHDGAHWPSDVLGGFAIASVLLFVALTLPRALVARLDAADART